MNSADTEASTHKRENKPFGTLGSDKKLANLFASLFYQISEELRQILTSVPRARTNEGLKKVKTPDKNCVVLIAITTSVSLNSYSSLACMFDVSWFLSSLKTAPFFFGMT